MARHRARLCLCFRRRSRFLAVVSRVWRWRFCFCFCFCCPGAFGCPMHECVLCVFTFAAVGLLASNTAYVGLICALFQQFYRYMCVVVFFFFYFFLRLFYMLVHVDLRFCLLCTVSARFDQRCDGLNASHHPTGVVLHMIGVMLRPRSVGAFLLESWFSVSHCCCLRGMDRQGNMRARKDS